MYLRIWWTTLAIFWSLGSTSIAQSELSLSPNIKQYAPRLVGIMSAAQNQHLKLWFAGKAKNWELAGFELRQLTDSLAEAAILYPGIPVSGVTKMQDPLLSIADAVRAGDGRKFVASMQKLTDGCNVCHRSMDRGYIVMSLPSAQQAPVNQVFAPQKANRTGY